MSLDDDEKLILQNGQTLRAAGVSKFSLLFINCDVTRLYIQYTPNTLA